eukprot:TRINITY_DN17059_c0_g1_i1.p1 TRINITY_DN17059_c0_g1~~TRINITY_DN17059_c0_g1_i1.p1  ORF type:complete len:250 (-),score=-6.96 TRINITY_DN17059_c0_g1_i1:104-853(-)
METRSYFGCNLCKYQLCTPHLQLAVSNQQTSQKRRKLTSVSICDLPGDVLRHVYGYLYIFEIRICASSCHLFKSVEKASLAQIHDVSLDPELIMKSLPEARRGEIEKMKETRLDVSPLLDVASTVCNKLKSLKLIDVKPELIEQGVFRTLGWCKSLENLHIECSSDGVQQINNPFPKTNQTNLHIPVSIPLQHSEYYFIFSRGYMDFRPKLHDSLNNELYRNSETLRLETYFLGLGRRLELYCVFCGSA